MLIKFFSSASGRRISSARYVPVDTDRWYVYEGTPKMAHHLAYHAAYLYDIDAGKVLKGNRNFSEEQLFHIVLGAINVDK